MSQESSQKLRLGALTALVVGSMIGGGIFSLPQSMAASADVGAVLIGQAITATGMLTLAFVFQTLANRKSGLGGDVYTYARAGSSDYTGFSSVWGYWISAWLGNVGYFALLFSTLGYFFPIFGKGNTVAAIVRASILLWVLYFLVSRGIKEAAFINTITTVARIVLLFLFILICLFTFKLDIFTADIWGKSNPDPGSVMNQVRNMMLVTVWVFIGIEGASIFSPRTEKRSDVGKATVIGFTIILLLLVLINVLSMGVMTQPELAKLQSPSMALVLEHVVGRQDAVLISVSLLISLLGALFSWVPLRIEIMFVTVKDHTMPEFLRYENANQVSTNALWLTNVCVQVSLVVVFLTSGDPDGMDPYIKMLLLATSMILIPYFWSAAYGLLLTLKDETYENGARERSKGLVIAGIAVVYAVWLFCAGGLKYLLLSTLLYAPGAILFAKAKHEVGQSIFTGIEKPVFAVVVIGALMDVYGLYDGFLIL